MISWIKVQSTLPDKPEVIRIAAALRIHRLHALGLCVALWAWADSQTSDGIIEGFDRDSVDALFGQPGFAEALERVGWLRVGDGAIVLPRFDRHNGTSAKKRAETARRVSKHRMKANPTDFERF